MSGPPEGVLATEVIALVREARSRSLVIGQRYFLVSRKWWDGLLKEIHEDDSTSCNGWDPTNHVLPTRELNQSDIIDDDDSSLLPELSETQYTYLPNDLFQILTGWFPCRVPIPRDVIAVGINQEPFLEVYRIPVHVKSLAGSESSSIEASRGWKLSMFLMQAAAAFNTPPHAFKTLWLEIDSEAGRVQLLNKSQEDFQKKIDDIGITDGCTVYLDKVDRTPTLHGYNAPSQPHIRMTQDKENPEYWTMEASESDVPPLNQLDHSRPTRTAQISGSVDNEMDGLLNRDIFESRTTKQAAMEAVGRPIGVCGLSNLGNTCFMNSALQCLSNTVPLTQYFIQDSHVGKININNPLGTAGQFVDRYAELIKAMWDGKHGFFAPTQFKWVVGRYRPSFSGYQQQDSQELIAFALDFLHEDLNQVIEKPYIEDPETQGRDDSEVAKEIWTNHTKRNQSIIVDLFQGLLKSVVKCPDCPKVSIKFDPFMYLTLPIPSTRQKAKRDIAVVRYQFNNKTLQPLATFSVSATVGTVCEALARHYKIPTHMRLVLLELTGDDSAICNPVPLELNMSSIPSEVNVKFYELPKEDRPTAAFYVRDEETSLPVGYPLLLTFDQESPLCSDVFDIVRQALEPVIATPMNISFRIVRISDVTVLVNEQVPYQGSINDTTFLIMLSGAQVNFDQLAALTVSNREIALDDTTPQHNFRVDLKECINLFSSEEQLSKRDQWFCPDCKADKQAFKKFDLFFLPEILVIHFKRFQYGALSRGKLETPVDYPFELDLSEWVRSTEHKQNHSCVYDLYAVSVHQGRGMGSGHYIAYAFNEPSKQWYCFNDRSVSPISPEQARSRDAYLLFYRRRAAQPENVNHSVNM